jgi:hypothetical protein
MLVYLFRQKRTSDRALTTAVTGRNLPSSTPYGPWVFVEMLNTENAKPPLGLADFKEALSRVSVSGYFIFKERN